MGMIDGVNFFVKYFTAADTLKGHLVPPLLVVGSLVFFIIYNLQYLLHQVE